MEIFKYVSRLTLPYKDIFTSIYTVKTEEGVLIFDTATTPEDVTERLIPFLREEGIALSDVKAVFISHFHNDHAGGLATLAPLVPHAKIFSRSKKLLEKFPGQIHSPEDGEVLFGCLQAITVPGHSRDSMALLDSRTGTLISGDCLQLFGIFGSGAWASNITLPRLHLEALEKLGALPIERIFAAHAYHPLGWRYEGTGAVAEALENCRAPLSRICDLIAANPSCSDEEIAALFRDNGKLPTLSPRVVTAVREELTSC